MIYMKMEMNGFVKIVLAPQDLETAQKIDYLFVQTVEKSFNF